MFLYWIVLAKHLEINRLLSEKNELPMWFFHRFHNRMKAKNPSNFLYIIAKLRISFKRHQIIANSVTFLLLLMDLLKAHIFSSTVCTFRLIITIHLPAYQLSSRARALAKTCLFTMYLPTNSISIYLSIQSQSANKLMDHRNGHERSNWFYFHRYRYQYNTIQYNQRNSCCRERKNPINTYLWI